MKEKRKLRDKMNLNMVIPGDVIDAGDEIELFSLKAVKTKKVKFQQSLHQRIWLHDVKRIIK